jgi:hypothetical protein
VSEAPLAELIMDAAGCQTRDEFYDLFFGAVGAPDWHGRNFNALRDSIATGQINRIEVPYRLVIANYDKIGILGSALSRSPMILST